MVFVKSHIPSRRLNDFKIPCNIQIIPFEINPGNKKWLVHQFTTLHPRKTNIFSEKVIILGDFNIAAENKVMKYFF